MKISSEIKYTLIVLAFGAVFLFSSLFILSISQRPVRQLGEINELEILLSKLESSAQVVTYDDEKVIELKNQVANISMAYEKFSDENVLITVHTSLTKLKNAIDQINTIHLQIEKQLLDTPDSAKKQVKFYYQTSVAGSKEIILDAAKEMDLILISYKRGLHDKIQSVSFYKSSYVLFIVAILLALAVLTYRKFKGVERYKVVVDEKFRKESKRIDTMNRFVEAIAEGRYAENIEFDEGDHLAERMVEMKNKLLLSADNDRKRNWATQGMAEIGTLLRDATTLEKLYANITKFCVRYTKSNQASLFVLNEENPDKPYLELVNTYAYDRRKFLQKKIDIGEGLTGQVVLEAQTIKMTKLPPDYIHITSGLGDAAPSALVIVPLKLNDKVFGVIEMASFHTYEDFEIQFLEELGESVASSISAARINDQTKTLLEKSQQQMEELRAQEEEVRQNMEELSATQEQMARQMEESKRLADDLQVRENVFALTTILSEADSFGTITMANNKLVEVSKYPREELIGKPHSIFRHPDMPKELFRIFWDTIKQGKVFRGIIKNRAKDGSHYWVDATIVPVHDQSGKLIKYIGARYHITDDNFAEHLYNLQAERLNLPPLAHHQQAA